MFGGDIKVQQGSVGVSETLSGTVRNLVLENDTVLSGKNVSIAPVNDLKVGRDSVLHSTARLDLTVKGQYALLGNITSDDFVKMDVKKPTAKQPGILHARNGVQFGPSVVNATLEANIRNQMNAKIAAEQKIANDLSAEIKIVQSLEGNVKECYLIIEESLLYPGDTNCYYPFNLSRGQIASYQKKFGADWKVQAARSIANTIHLAETERNHERLIGFCEADGIYSVPYEGYYRYGPPSIFHQQKPKRGFTFSLGVGTEGIHFSGQTNGIAPLPVMSRSDLQDQFSTFLNYKSQLMQQAFSRVNLCREQQGVPIMRQHMEQEMRNAPVAKMFGGPQSVSTPEVQRLKTILAQNTNTAAVQRQTLENFLNTQKREVQSQVEFYPRLTKAFTNAGMDGRDIDFMYNDPVMDSLRNFKTKQDARYPELYEVAERVRYETYDFSQDLNSPARRVIDECVIPLLVIASALIPGPQQVFTIPAATAMCMARAVPLLERVAGAFGASYVYNQAMKSLNESAGKGRVIPTHPGQRKFIENKMNVKEWAKINGKMLYEDKNGLRYIPTKEKFEFEVGKKISGKWNHVGIMRENEGFVRYEFGKGVNYGKYFE